MVAVVGAMLVLSTIAFVLWHRDPTVANEHRIIEWSQVVFLVIAAVIHIWRTRSRSANADHVVRLTLALLCASLAVRETDIDDLSSAAMMPAVETTVRLLVIVAGLILLWRVVRAFNVLWSRACAIAFTGVGLFTIAGCLLYAASWPVDKYPVSLAGGRPLAMVIEETIQLNATFLLFMASLSTLPPDTA